MTALGIQVGWLVVRITVVGLFAAVLLWWSTRHAAHSAVIVLATTMTIVLALSLAAFVPVSEYCHWSPMIEAIGPSIADAENPIPVEFTDDAPADGFALGAVWRMLRDLGDQQPNSSAWQDASAVLLTLYGLGIAVFGMRLLAGWLAVKSLRRRSRPICEAGLVELVDSLRDVLGCSRQIEMRECAEPGLAATVGWWRPVIFLPPEWPTWTGAELRAVLAHELSHIRHGDYLIGLMTRLCQAIHFYHPLMHWLSAQLRWQQELAADELAATALTDRHQYLQAIASLALRSPARTSAGAMPWSTMTGGTLLRRIHMLRGARNARPLGWALRGLLVGILTGIGALLMTLGSSATQTNPLKDNAEPFEIGYLPPDAKGFIAIRPAYLLQQPGMEKVTRQLADGLLQLKKLGLTVPDGLKPENIEEMVVDFRITSDGTGKPGSRALQVGGSSLYLRLKQDFDWPAFFKNLSKEVSAMTGKEGFEVTEIRGGLTYRVGMIPMVSPVPIHFHMPDRRSVVFSGIARKPADPKTDAESFRQLIQNVTQARRRDWGGYSKVAGAPIAVVLDNHNQEYAKVLATDVEPQELKVLENIRFAAIGIDVGRPVRLLLDAPSAATVPDLEKGVERVVRVLQEKLQKTKPDEQDKAAIKLLTELIASRKLHREGNRLEWVGFSSVRIPDLLAFLDNDSPKRPAKSQVP